MKRKALGKGLSALLPEGPSTTGGPMTSGEKWAEVDIERIDPNPYQPRQHIEDSSLNQLAHSVSQQGLVQPLLVRRLGSRYQLIAGERRWRAARLAGLAQVPVVLRDVPENQLLELALIENIQREELNPIEEASAYKRLISELGLSQEQIAERVSKDRSTIANLLRLLRLPASIREGIARQQLSPGHARPLLALGNAEVQTRIAQDVIDRGLSVREVENRVRALLSEKKSPAMKRRKATRVDPNTRAAEDKLRKVLGTRVRILRKGRAGTVEISYYSEAELNRIYEVLLRGARGKLSRVR